MRRHYLVLVLACAVGGAEAPPTAKWLERLGSLTVLDNVKSPPPLDRACAPLPLPSLIIDRRLVAAVETGRKDGLSSLDPPTTSLAFRAVNDLNVQSVLQSLLHQPGHDARVRNAVLRPIEYVAVVNVVELHGPGLAGDGSFTGELWVVDAERKAILCRARVTATGRHGAPGRRGNEIEAAFAGEVQSAIAAAWRRIAPAR